jgi:hypothetical protein
MTKNRIFILCIFLATLIGTGCMKNIKVEKLRTISLGMSKEEVVKNLGESTVVRGSIRNKLNQVVEIWEYELVVPQHTSAGQELQKLVWTAITLGAVAGEAYKDKIKSYWLYFYDNKLAQWGEAGDWSKESDRIYKFDFNPSPKITK